MSAWLDQFFPDPDAPPHDLPVALKTCPACKHKQHAGVCGLPVERYGIEDQCLCLDPTPASLNHHELRTRDVIQQADIRDIERRDLKTGDEIKKERRERKKWVRLSRGNVS